MRFTTLSLSAVALGAVAVVFGGPVETTSGFSTIGGSLSLSQRDVRVFDNFIDPGADNNTSAQQNFPGALGLELAIWKAISEWGSRPHASGAGDPTQTDLGNGGANFDASWQGNASGVGGPNDNVISTISSCSGATLAFVESPISNGWRMRFCENVTWNDNSGSGSGTDIQSIATHEYGHSLGLGHSTVGGTTMFATFFGGLGSRSIAPDDIAGVQSIYGVASASKPEITSVVVSGSQVTITGTGFTTTGNEVWFTNANVTSPGSDPRVRLFGVNSTAGGTQIVVTAPANAGPGDILVRHGSGAGGSNLSNAYPADIGGNTGGGPITVSSVTPFGIPALMPGSEREVSIHGTGFTPATQVTVNGIQLTGIPNPVQFVSSNELRFDMPQQPNLGLVLITVSEGGNMASTFGNVVPPATPQLQCGIGDPNSAVFQFAGLPIIMSSQPGDLVYLMYSSSPIPSVFAPIATLAMGNNFTNIPPVGTGFYTIENRGWTQLDLPLSGISNLPTVYSQMVRINDGPPYEASNLQNFIIF